MKLGAHTFLRVGNSGGLDPSLALGDLVVTTGAVRDDGTSPQLRGARSTRRSPTTSWSARCSAAARERGARCRAGITWSLDAFYVRNAVLTPDGSLGLDERRQLLDARARRPHHATCARRAC